MAENGGAPPRGAAEASSPTSAGAVADGGGGGAALDDLANHRFICCVCLDLIYKPVVLACGHISCFWCVHKAMHGVQESHCALCRKPYIHFPSICQLLHQLLLNLEPAAYKRREKEVLEEEKRLKVYSPQFVDRLISKETHSANGNCKDTFGARSSTAAKEPSATEHDLVDDASFPLSKRVSTDDVLKKVSVDDVLCSICKALLYRPAVLNCGHVYCENCLLSLIGEELKCQICQSPHPGGFPNVCLYLDNFLEETFPVEYASRKEKVKLKKIQYHQGDSSSSAEPAKKQESKPFQFSNIWLNENAANIHAGVGCDSCGVYPIIGKRYKCEDCKEAIGFDLCEECYKSCSNLPGRFNQQHTQDHKFVLDDSRTFQRILWLARGAGDHLQVVEEGEHLVHVDLELEAPEYLEPRPESDGDDDDGTRQDRSGSL
ncbi:E3 ubiquitin-protein ligase PRT1 [Ananas comosus]|uniref:E3 ubiquitin-protein ligase PRT1 n=1 Tax=Ananas comosus TaxID=4615 RepID=A0A6P5EMA7_ANACO|nr:E3 ubiquitin-protein ligase PRT1 [Ananas comosus]